MIFALKAWLIAAACGTALSANGEPSSGTRIGSNMVNPFHSLTPGKTAWISIIDGSLSKKYA
jgi:hypothetical protein